MTEEEMLALLGRRSGGLVTRFRPAQWQAVREVLAGQGRTLLVQATGWGKSLVYFAATTALRQRGDGPTVVVSPLLSLMADQVAAARRHGLAAAAINTDTPDDWEGIHRQLDADRLDILFIAPERLASDSFVRRAAGSLRRVALLVLDEAHCVSDWGHDFRPDYRRLRRLLAEQLPAGLPVLATTATANARVIADLQQQLGSGTRLLRGPLARPSLILGALRLPSPAARMAWLAQTLPRLEGSGIIYALTVADASRLARFLRDQGLAVEAYHARLGGGGTASADLRRGLEERLRADDLKALVATSALGMGFDKPDLRFILHYQCPASPVHYYQQIGRAGRAVDSAPCILLAGAEDEAIHRHFIDNAAPDETDVAQVLDCLDEAEEGLTETELMRVLPLSQARLHRVLRNLSVLDEPPLLRQDGRWQRTGHAWRSDREREDALGALRQAEWRQMQGYLAAARQGAPCLMTLLTGALDDPAAEPCGRCANCRKTGGPWRNPWQDPWRKPGWLAIRRCAAWNRRNGWIALPPREAWPEGALSGRDGPIPEELRTGWGRALGRDGEGRMERPGRAAAKALAGLVWDWDPRPEPQWVTAVPAAREGEKEGEAERLAAGVAKALGLPYRGVLQRRPGPSRPAANDWQRAHRLDGRFLLHSADCPPTPVLLVDAHTRSGWSFALCGALLREQGVTAVHPLALCLEGRGF